MWYIDYQQKWHHKFNTYYMFACGNLENMQLKVECDVSFPLAEVWESHFLSYIGKHDFYANWTACLLTIEHMAIEYKA